MTQFAKNFVVGSVFMGIGSGVLIGAVIGSAQFWLWLSGGQLWGLAGFVASAAALVGGIGFAASEASE